MKCTCCGEETDVQYRLGDAAPAFQGMCRRCVLNWGEIDMACYDCGKWLSRTAYKLYGKYYCVQCFLKNTVITDETPSYAQTWISVKDRLPEPNTWVLVYVKYTIPVFEMERGIRKLSDVKKVFFDGRFIIANKPTHWMPLPQKPESEDDAE